MSVAKFGARISQVISHSASLHAGYLLRRSVPCVDGSGLARAFFTQAALVGAAMCSAFRCGSHDRWP